jgi:hypothetical protein
LGERRAIHVTRVDAATGQTLKLHRFENVGRD